MAWSYRKRIKIVPGISINLSKSGISTSFGPRGAKVTVGPKGTYLNTSIPGAGIYSRQKIGSTPKSNNQSYASGLFDSSSYASSNRSSNSERFGVDMEMDRKGNLTFSFTDSLGHPITDEATRQKLIRKTKALPFYKDKLAEITRMTYEEVNADTEAFTDIYKKTPQLKTESEISTALSRISPKHYSLLTFEEDGPDKEKIQQELVLEAKQKIRHLFWWKNKPEREKYVAENTPIVYDRQLREWENKRDAFYAKEIETKKRLDAEYYHEYLEERSPLQAFLSRNKDEIIAAIRTEANKINEDVPGDFGISFYFDSDYSVLYIELDLPEVEEIPKDKAVYLPSGNVSFKQKTVKEIQLDYVKCICGLAFYVAGRMFNANVTINYIQISGYTQRVNKATGVADNDYVYSVFFDKDSFSLLSVEYIDPLEALREFPSRIKASVTGVLSSISPFAIPGENDEGRGMFPQKEGRNNSFAAPVRKAEIDDDAYVEIVPSVENADRLSALYISGTEQPQLKQPLPIEDLGQTTYLNNLGIQQEKDGLIDEAIATYEENIKIGYPAHHSYKRLMVLYAKKHDKTNELRIAKLAVEKFPDELEYKKRLEKLTGTQPKAIYPTSRVVFEGGEVVGDVFESVIRNRIPEFDFYQSETGHWAQNDFISFKRELEPVFRLQQHFRSILDAAERFEADGDFEKACLCYEQLLFEKYYMPAPYDRLIKIYSRAKLKMAEKEVLSVSIDHFKALRESRYNYVEDLAEKYGALEFFSKRMEEGKKITYYMGCFELFNPFPIIEDWEKRLAKID